MAPQRLYEWLCNGSIKGFINGFINSSTWLYNGFINGSATAL
jgi:hypothetical protein